MHLFLSISSFLLANAAENADLPVDDQIQAAHLPYCETDSNNNCNEDPYYDGQDYTTTDLEFVGAYTDGHSCCYKYKATSSDRADCTGKTSKQSSLLLGYICDKDKYDSLKITDGTGQLVDDESMCMHGIALDDVDSKGRSKTYVVCIAWDLYAYEEPQCCTGEGFYATKSRTTYAFGSVQVPKCNCQTEDPTPQPTSTPDCKPIVKVFVNEDCDEKDFQYGHVEVYHAPIMEYKDPGMVGYPITDKPQDTLAENVLQSICDDPYGNNYYPFGFFDYDDGYSTGVNGFLGELYYGFEAARQDSASRSLFAYYPAEQSVSNAQESAARRIRFLLIAMIAAIAYGLITTCLYCKARFSAKKNWKKISREEAFAEDDK